MGPLMVATLWVCMMVCVALVHVCFVCAVLCVACRRRRRLRLCHVFCLHPLLVCPVHLMNLVYASLALLVRRLCVRRSRVLPSHGHAQLQALRGPLANLWTPCLSRWPRVMPQVHPTQFMQCPAGRVCPTGRGAVMIRLESVRFRLCVCFRPCLFVCRLVGSCQSLGGQLQTFGARRPIRAPNVVRACPRCRLLR